MADYSDTTKRIKKLIFDTVIETGFAPKVDEIVNEMKVSEDEIRSSLHDLEGGIIIALQNENHAKIKTFMGEKLPKDAVLPEIGEIFYARPFSNFKNHHRVYVDDEQKWYAECSLEATSLSNFFPGKEVVVQSVCAHKKEKVELIQRDGILIDYKPKGLLIHAGLPLRKWLSEGDLIAPCDNNRFFSSRESYFEWKRKHEDIKSCLMHPIEANRLIRVIAYGRTRFDYRMYLSLRKFILQYPTMGITTKYIFPKPYWLPGPGLIKNFIKHKYKPFIEFRLW
ncbi:MAG: organomercurial lyase [Spirochaetota bacterium]|nr:organomercurial lyase [Spirochaetota bacterium]